MEAALLHFILDVAAARLAHVTQHLGEHPFQRVVAHLTTRRSVRVLDRLVTIVTDIEGGAIEVAGVLCGVAVATTEFHNIVLRTEHTSDDDLMEGHTLDVEAIEKRLSDVLQQYGSTRHLIGYAGIEGIDMEIRIGTYINQFTLTRLSILTVLDGCDAPAVSCS